MKQKNMGLSLLAILLGISLCLANTTNTFASSMVQGKAKTVQVVIEYEKQVVKDKTLKPSSLPKLRGIVKKITGGQRGQSRVVKPANPSSGENTFVANLSYQDKIIKITLLEPLKEEMALLFQNDIELPLSVIANLQIEPELLVIENGQYTAENGVYQIHVFPMVHVLLNVHPTDPNSISNVEVTKIELKAASYLSPMAHTRIRLNNTGLIAKMYLCEDVIKIRTFSGYYVDNSIIVFGDYTLPENIERKLGESGRSIIIKDGRYKLNSKEYVDIKRAKGGKKINKKSKNLKPVPSKDKPSGKGMPKMKYRSNN